MLTLRTLTAMVLVLVLAAGAYADKKGRGDKNQGPRNVQRRDKFRSPQGDKFRVQKARRGNGFMHMAAGTQDAVKGAAARAADPSAGRPLATMPDPGVLHTGMEDLGAKGGQKAARSNGPTIVPTSNSAGKAKPAASTLGGDPDQPLGAFTDDNGSPSELGLSVKARSSGANPMPRGDK